VAFNRANLRSKPSADAEDVLRSFLALAWISKLNRVGPLQVPPRSTIWLHSGTQGATMSTRIYVGNLSFNTSEDSLRTLCGADGRNVAKVNIVTDRETGQPRGFAFVDFLSEHDAAAAITAMNGTELDGRAIMVNEAREREYSGRSKSGPRGY